MIDFHSHVLPEIDDGSKSVEQSLQMMTLSFQQGVTHMVATPHFYASKAEQETFFLSRSRAYDQLMAAQPMGPELLLGAEVAYYPNMSGSDAIRDLRIQGSDLLLVEMPFTEWTDRMIEDLCNLQHRQGLVPLLAHVNRYRGKGQFPHYAEELRECGVICQCNAEAFTDFLSCRWALKQLKNGTVQLLGSDCHNMDSRPPLMGLVSNVIQKKSGFTMLRKIDRFAYEVLNLGTNE